MARAPVVAVVALPRLPSEVVSPAAPYAGMRGVVVNEVGASFVLRSVLTLVDAGDAARALGVVPGMRIIDAQVHAPTLAFDVVPRARIDDELRVVAEVLLACAPLVQPFAPATWTRLPMAAVALDLTGMARAVDKVLVDVQRACARLGHKAVVAASPGTRLSFALARALTRAHRSDVTTLYVKARDVPRALARLPIDALGLSADLAAQLTALGARTAGDVERLLPRGAVERLGAESRAILDVVAARYAPLRGLVPPERIVERMDLDHPLTDVEPLIFVQNNLCNRICMRARGRGLRIAEVSLSLERRRGEGITLVVAFPDALLDDKAMLRALQVHLERTSLGGPIDRVALEVTRLARRAPRQLSLEPGAAAGVRAEDALAGLLAEMAQEIGAAHVGCLVVTDEALPERMTKLAWPAPPPPARPPAPERRRPRNVPALPADAVTSGGRFLAGWPWPLRLLPRPVRMGRDLSVVSRESLFVLEGEDRNDQPYARTYELLAFTDGRRALGLFDEEAEETWLHGWFD
jgi:hypothetical protein